jgi:hypothetical protein
MAKKQRGALAAQQELRELEQALVETGRRLRQAYDTFNLVSDPDLVEAWVYEISAQQARYNYLSKQLRAARNASEGGAV